MAMYNENAGNLILDVLRYPAVTCCYELPGLFDRCGLRELQDIFPTLVNAIFGIGSGGLGWGLRTTVREISQHSFDSLQEFFSPMGPMLKLCYQLLNDSIKFEVSLDLLPNKVAEMIQSGQFSVFYGDLVTVDAFRRQVTALSLNAFDYYMLHFVVHAKLPLHKLYPAALQVHNELHKTVYFRLAAEYLCCFMPGNPDTVVQPTNICATAKTPQVVPAQPMQPIRTPRYLKIPNSNVFCGQGQNSSPGSVSHNSETPRDHTWRTESVLYFFLDIWLRYDVDEARDLPSSEFIRVARVLVKQAHTFASSADADHTAMRTLRKLVGPMMKAHIYPFLKSLIGRWPLDSSMSVVLELWFSYIQPWRYTYELNTSTATSTFSPDVSISNRFDSFIADNLIIYTQIFVHVLPRFERLDFTSFRSAVMLYRLVKVFGQSTLPGRLYQAELAYTSNAFRFDPPAKRSTGVGHKRSGACEWESFYNDELYTPMFGSAIRKEIERFIRTVHISSMYMQQDISGGLNDKNEKLRQFTNVGRFFASVFGYSRPSTYKPADSGKIPGVLSVALESLCRMFDIPEPNISMEQLEPPDQTVLPANFSQYNCSDYMDITKVSPTQMMNNLNNISAGIDPAQLPMQSYECELLVRLLHRVSSKINEVYGDELQRCWNRSDFCGKLARQFLYPPMTAQWFDKPKGITELCEEQIGARLCLRAIADYKVLALLGLSMFVGGAMWGAPIYGLMLLLWTFVAYIIVRAILS